MRWIGPCREESDDATGLEEDASNVLICIHCNSRCTGESDSSGPQGPVKNDESAGGGIGQLYPHDEQ